MPTNDDARGSSGDVAGFGSTALGLAKNPLGIIALFIVMVYGFACLFAGLGRGLDKVEREPLIYFIAIFPVLVLTVFAWLVSRHHKKLYGPRDYKDENHFVELAKPELGGLRVVSPDDQQAAAAQLHARPGLEQVGAEAARGNDGGIPNEAAEWERTRSSIYAEARKVMLVHALQPSNKRGQKYDVFIYVLRHPDGEYSADLSDITSVDFYLGRYWGNKIFKGSWSGRYLGIRTSVYGSFLCVCKVTFVDGGTALLHRYIDFEMGELAAS